jgi:hypothetical protein
MSGVKTNGETAKKSFYRTIGTMPNLPSGRGRGRKPIDHVVYEC